ncbi:hypothetical protein C8R43DRAFT_519571 [Mycena crocata]|nr:hypothetical protein C8R43DRAFT_519571 [Mycena crocata]
MVRPSLPPSLASLNPCLLIPVPTPAMTDCTPRLPTSFAELRNHEMHETSHQTQSAYPAFAMGGLCIAGGVAGFARTRSVPSLVAGVGCVSFSTPSFPYLSVPPLPFPTQDPSLLPTSNATYVRIRAES